MEKEGKDTERIDPRQRERGDSDYLKQRLDHRQHECGGGGYHDGRIEQRQSEYNKEKGVQRTNERKYSDESGISVDEVNTKHAFNKGRFCIPFILSFMNKYTYTCTYTHKHTRIHTNMYTYTA